jgi:hypothetical protein
MPVVNKILGQSVGDATAIDLNGTVVNATYAATTLYSGPGVGSSANVTPTYPKATGIVVCNLTNQIQTFSVAIVPNGETLATRHLIYYLTPLPARTTFLMALDIPLDPRVVVKVAGSTLGLTFALTGEESRPPRNPRG